MIAKRIAFALLLSAMTLGAFGKSSSNRRPTTTTADIPCQQCIEAGCICYLYGNGHHFCDCYGNFRKSR